MSDLHHSQHRVQFATTAAAPEGAYDDEYRRLRNYYAPLASHRQDSSSPPPPSASSLGDRVLPVAQSRTRASSSGSESFPSPDDHSITALYPPPTSTSPPTAAAHRPQQPLGSMHDAIIDQSRAHDSERVIEVSPDAGRYLRLNSVLGKGAYKIVYKAIDREEGYEVAWNAMQAPNSSSSSELAHEIQILKSVRHPNIIAFHDAWHTENEFVFITELMTSGTLREYIRKLSLPNVKIVKRWVRQILKGLTYLHGHDPPIIHRDIKCDNIFINGAYGEVKIGDMGTAKMKMGKKYTIIGTPEFMAPEMYEESGYSEKVDIYAFGMCLLEMATGEYPYSECTNAAQIYRKVSAGVKPASLATVQNTDMLAVIDNCLGPEHQRMSAHEILEHALFAIEPEVVLLATDDSNVHLTLQVVFKGVDKRSVKFDFNVEMDTPEEVVHEMIEENILPEQYQQHIAKEIARILREWDNDCNTTHKAIWRREAEDYGSELERVRHELQEESEQLAEKEKECDVVEAHVRKTEERWLEVTHLLQDIKGSSTNGPETLAPVTATAAIPYEQPPVVYTEYSDDTDIRTFIQDCAQAAHRGMDKAQEWIHKLQDQDIMTVGDLRHLQDEDWEGIGLTVFALRAVKNMLKGKQSARHTTPL